MSQPYILENLEQNLSILFHKNTCLKLNYHPIEQEDLRKPRNVHRGSQVSERLVSPAEKEGFILQIFSDDSEYFS